MTGYIYVLVDPRTDEIRYVGRTIRSLKKRLTGHLAAPVNPRMRDWLNELSAVQMRPVIRVLEEVDHESIFEREHFWILKMASTHALLNRVPGAASFVPFTLRLPIGLRQEIRQFALAHDMSVNDAIILIARQGQHALL
jgi:hypothetical protein